MKTTRLVLITMAVQLIVTLVAPAPAGAAGNQPAPHARLVKDIDPRRLEGLQGVGTVGFSANPLDLTSVGDAAFFLVNHPRLRYPMLAWSDGTHAGTHIVKDFAAIPGFKGDPEASPLNLTAFGSSLFFGVDDGVHGLEMWRSDGTEAGTSMFLDLNPGPAQSQSNSGRDLIVVGDRLYFLADDGEHGAELWKTDGTQAGTALVKDINPGPGQGVTSQFGALGDTLYFGANDGEHGWELWKTDGTGPGTVRVTDIGPGPADTFPDFITAAGGRVFFTTKPKPAGDDKKVLEGAGVWVTDGTAEGTTLLRPGLGHGDLSAAGNRVFFVTQDDDHGRELAVSDGTVGGTEVLDVTPGPDSTFIGTMLVPFADGILFMATDAAHGPELWRSDGTAVGTRLVRDIFLGEFGSSPVGITVLGNRAFFTAYGGYHGNELWCTDGTPGGTFLVRDIDSGSRGSVPGGFVRVKDFLLFAADDIQIGRELWRVE